MFKQVIFADWSGVVAILAFAASVGIFLFFLIGAIRTPKERIRRDANLPFENDPRP